MKSSKISCKAFPVQRKFLACMRAPMTTTTTFEYAYELARTLIQFFSTIPYRSASCRHTCTRISIIASRKTKNPTTATVVFLHGKSTAHSYGNILCELVKMLRAYVFPGTTASVWPCVRSVAAAVAVVCCLLVHSSVCACVCVFR